MTCSKSMFRELQWLPFPLRVEYHSCIMMYKAMNNQTPQYTSNLFTMASEIHNRNLRSAEQNILTIPYSRACYFERSFQIDFAKRWNVLPLNIPNSNSLPAFKISLKAHLIQKL